MRAAEPSSCRSGVMGAATTTRGDHAAAAASSSTARLTAAARLRCRRKNIPPRASSIQARGSQLPTRRIDATGKSGFKTVSPKSADAEQPQCSATSVFLALGPTGNGPRDSSFVHTHERPRGPPRARPLGAGLSSPRVLPHALRKTEAGFERCELDGRGAFLRRRRTQSRPVTRVTQPAERPILR
jgi:hypothetical protein